MKYTFDIATLTSEPINANGCNAIMFKNNSYNTPNPLVILQVNGYNIREGEQLVLSGHIGEIDISQYQCTIIDNGGTVDCFVIRKYYASNQVVEPLNNNTH